LTGIIVQVNVSRGGVPKHAVAGAFLSFLGFEGDSCAHPSIHGGAGKAVLVIASEVVAELARRGYPVFPGALGENLTTRGIDPRLLRIGQQWRAGGAVIEIASVRRPCSALDVYGPGIQGEIFDPQVKAGNYLSPRWGMSGFYAHVIQPGLVRPEDIIVLLAESA
jgi:MOSC domain-containing protein YiiM